MKTLWLTLVAILYLSFFTHAQTNNIGMGTSTPDSSAMLEILSNDKGLLVPRMTTVERLAIPSPADALLVYDIDSSCFYFYKQPIAQWINLCNVFTEKDPEVGANATNSIPKWDGNALISGSITDSTGHIGIGTTTPAARLDVTDGTVLFQGTTGTTPVSGAGTRLMWIPAKGAIRAGWVTGPAWDNDSVGLYSAVIGGLDNTAYNTHSFVGGGNNNKSLSLNGFIGGGAFNYTWEFQENIFVGGGSFNIGVGINSFVGGGNNNWSGQSNAFVGGGNNNSAGAPNAFIGGGSYNDVESPSSFNSFIGGGSYNRMYYGSSNAFIGGGSFNTAYGLHAFIGGGLGNVASDTSSFVGGGNNNSSLASNAFVGGGRHNEASDTSSFVGGGSINVASRPHSFVGGGSLNTASGLYAFVGGGRHNEASDTSSFVGGGFLNVATHKYSFIGGGSLNTASGLHAFVGGGLGNVASDTSSFVGGGAYNWVDSRNSFIGGGSSNWIRSSNAFIGGGNSNVASRKHSFIGGGFTNIANGDYSFVGGGVGLSAQSYSEAVFGTFNTDYVPASQDSFKSADRLFVIGNGTVSLRSDALVILKNGNTGLGTSMPTQTLDINGSLRVRNVTNNNNKDSVLVIAGDGKISYRDAVTFVTQTSSVVGDVKQGFQCCDHEGWVLLDGRLKSTLNATQQTNANSLGFGANIPDAEGKILFKNGPVNTQGGSDSITIAQANLPNITFNGTTGTAGAHNHGGFTGFSTVSARTNIGSGNTSYFFQESGTSTANIGNHRHSISTDGSHTHPVSVPSGGSDTPIPITPSYLSVNMFIFLGQ